MNIENNFIELSRQICKEIDHYLKFDAISNLHENYNITNIKNDLDNIIIKNSNNYKNIIGYITKTNRKLEFKNLKNNEMSKIENSGNKENSEKKEHSENQYILGFSSLDGTFNYESQLNCGTILGLYSYNKDNCQIENIVNSSYILYSINTILVYNLENKIKMDIVSGFNNFINIKIPFKKNKIYSINNNTHDKELDFLIRFYKSNEYKFRYSGCLVVDFHNILINNGIFYYPDKNINIYCQALPLAYLFRLLDGVSFNQNNKNILDNISLIKNIDYNSSIIFASCNEFTIYNELLKVYEINKY